MKNNTKSSLYDSIYKQADCLSVEQIRDYVNQKLTPAEKHQVQNHLLQCPICSDAVEGAETYAGEYEKMVAESKRQLKFRLKSKKIVWMYRTSWVAAAAIVMFFLLNVQEYFQKQSPCQILYQQYFEPYPNTIPLVRGNQSANQLQYAMAAYEIGDYKKSLSYLKPIYKAHPDSSIVRFYTGMCYLGKNNSHDALKVLGPLTENQADVYYTKALWYTALALMKEGHIGKSGQILSQLSEKNHEFTEKSVKLIHEMKRIANPE